MDERSLPPPFTLTPAILALVVRVAEAVGRMTATTADPLAPRLRRANRIRTIQGSLAIEGNTLSVEQMTAILEGKHVVAPPREIQEVRNAIAAYDRIGQWNPYSESDLLDAHRVLMAGLLDRPGMWRHEGVGVMAGARVVHLAPPAHRVQQLMRGLLDWLAKTPVHFLVVSAVFHYEFEFIHPFLDGNGRLGRLWQTVILARWNPLFAYLPIESLVHANQEAYYQALQQSTEQTDCAPFIEFMLRMLRDALAAATPGLAPEVPPEVERLLHALAGETLRRRELQARLGLQDEKHFRQHYLQPALAAGLLEMTVPDKPRSRMQRYRLTDKGWQWVRVRTA